MAITDKNFSKNSRSEGEMDFLQGLSQAGKHLFEDSVLTHDVKRVAGETVKIASAVLKQWAAMIPDRSTAVKGTTMALKLKDDAYDHLYG